jgi:hypothetical protein
MRVPDPTPKEDPLVGWEEIAKYLSVEVRTVHRFRKRAKCPLPYHTTWGHPWALPSELQVWLRQGTSGGQCMSQDVTVNDEST